MAQLTLYVSDDLEKALRREAKRVNKSLSAYVAQLAGPKLKPTKWPRAFVDTFGSWKGNFPAIKKLPFERRDSF